MTEFKQHTYYDNVAIEAITKFLSQYKPLHILFDRTRVDSIYHINSCTVVVSKPRDDRSALRDFMNVKVAGTDEAREKVLDDILETMRK